MISLPLNSSVLSTSSNKSNGSKLIRKIALVLSLALVGSVFAGVGSAKAVSQLTTSGIPSINIVLSQSSTATFNPPTVYASTNPNVAYTSGGSWTWSTTSPSVATVSGTTITGVAPGVTTLLGSWVSTDTNYTAFVSTGISVTSGTVTLGTFAPISVTFSNNPVLITPPTSNSTGAWSFVSSNQNIVRINGNYATTLDGGTVTITANQAATAGYPSATATTTFTSVATTATLGSTPNLLLSLGTSQTLTPPTSNSSGAWSYISNNPAIATINGTTVTPVAAGTTTITATQAAVAPYASSTVTISVLVTTAPTKVASFPDVVTTYVSGGTNSFTLTPPSTTSTGVWSYYVSDSTIASITNGVVSILKPGQVTILALQAANGSSPAYGPYAMTLTAQGTPTLTPVADITKNFGDNAFSVVVQSTGTAPVTYASSNTNVVSVTGNVFTIVGAGTATITASSAASGAWSAASTTFKITVNGTAPTIGTAAPVALNVGQSIALTPPTSNSTGTWVYSIGNTQVATLSGNTITGVAAGTTTLTIYQNGAGQYTKSNVITATVTVTGPVIVANLFKNISFYYGSVAPDIILPVTASQGAWSFTSSNPAVVALNGTVIKPLKVGSVVITATQAASLTYPATKTTFVVKVLKKKVVKKKAKK